MRKSGQQFAYDLIDSDSEDEINLETESEKMMKIV